MIVLFFEHEALAIHCFLTPQPTAKAMVAGFKRRNSEIAVGWQGRMTVWCDRILPGLVDCLMP
jgi:3-oxoacyl-[acyl-carrier protein] reductase